MNSLDPDIDALAIKALSEEEEEGLTEEVRLSRIILRDAIVTHIKQLEKKIDSLFKEIREKEDAHRKWLRQKTEQNNKYINDLNFLKQESAELLAKIYKK